MAQQIDPIPHGYHSVTPVLVLRNGIEAVTFYQNAFGAQVLNRMNRPDGKLMHAAVKIGNSILMMGEECAPHEGHAENCVRSPSDLQGTTVNLYIYVADVDAVFQQALQAGAKQIMPVADMFWGDRTGTVRDPYGHVWSIATHTQDLTDEQIQQKAQEIFSRPDGQGD